ncbi:MAG: hypothetical protein OHK0017_03490 [Patescibacteria group bacterium]
MSYPKKLIALFALAAALSGSILLSNGIVVEAASNEDTKYSINRKALDKIKYSLQDKIKTTETNKANRLKRLEDKRNKLNQRIQKLKARGKNVVDLENKLAQLDEKLSQFKTTEVNYFDTLENLAKVNKTKNLKKLMSETGSLEAEYNQQLKELKELIQSLEKDLKLVK